MEKKVIIEMAVKFLEEYSDELSKNGCADFDLNELFPLFDDKVRFVKGFHQWNGDLDQWRDDGCYFNLSNFAVVKYIASLLKDSK